MYKRHVTQLQTLLKRHPFHSRPFYSHTLLRNYGGDIDFSDIGMDSIDTSEIDVDITFGFGSNKEEAKTREKLEKERRSLFYKCFAAFWTVVAVMNWWSDPLSHSEPYQDMLYGHYDGGEWDVKRELECVSFLLKRPTVLEEWEDSVFIDNLLRMSEQSNGIQAPITISHMVDRKVPAKLAELVLEKSFSEEFDLLSMAAESVGRKHLQFREIIQKVFSHPHLFTQIANDSVVLSKIEKMIKEGDSQKVQIGHLALHSLKMNETPQTTLPESFQDILESESYKKDAELFTQKKNIRLWTIPFIAGMSLLMVRPWVRAGRRMRGLVTALSMGYAYNNTRISQWVVDDFHNRNKHLNFKRYNARWEFTKLEKKIVELALLVATIHVCNTVSGIFVLLASL